MQAIGLIERFTAEISDYPDYEKDFKTQSAVERQLGIIGEALNKFEKLYPESKIDNSKKIVGLRNRLIHTYDSIDPTMIWAILKNHLPPLKSEVSKLIKA
ncbi:MAG TPA: HepT-like ribonuclease domain-containing protein [Bacteroidales bacterium]|nr:HepT-like ribonuclease domain-containing protein [Bacteroidales bacterium]